MKLHVQEIKDLSIVRIDGNVMHEEVTKLKNCLEELLFRAKCKVIIDLEKTEYISSMCLAVFVEIKKKISIQHGDLVLSSPGRVVKTLLEITNLNRKFSIYTNIEDAIKFLS